MDTIMGLGMVVWLLALVVIGFCLFISPLMIWKHTKETSRKLDEIINMMREKSQSL